MTRFVIGDLCINTEYWAKPIPMRQFDWEATTDDYEGGDPIGHGPTEIEAVMDLVEQIYEQDDDKLAPARGIGLALVLSILLWGCVAVWAVV